MPPHQRKADAVELSMDPEELAKLSQAELQARYDNSRTTSSKVHVPGADANREGFGDIVADERSKRSRGEQKQRERRAEKKDDKFKF